jgi:hypothetical protein
MAPPTIASISVGAWLSSGKNFRNSLRPIYIPASKAVFPYLAGEKVEEPLFYSRRSGSLVH